ncbi:MAG: DUF1801 domain-containing protein [Pseudomonadota bacterium]
MPGQKTLPTGAKVLAFLESVTPERRRDDGLAMLEMMKRVTGLEPKMWGPSIVGFGQYHYRYDSGHEGDSFLVGFSPRKQALTVYIMPGFAQYADLMAQLGKHSVGRSCLYIRRLDQVDHKTLENLIGHSFQFMRDKYAAP